MGGNESKPRPEKLSQIPSSFDDDDVIFQFDPESYSQGSLLDLDNTLLFLRTISSIVPFLKPFYSLPKAILDNKEHVDNILDLVGNVNEIWKLMMDSKISKASMDTAKSLLNAEHATLKIARGRMYNEKISLKDKEDEVVPAFQSCIRVKTLFGDKSFAFWKNIIPSSELLLHFSALYADVMWLSVSFKESYRNDAIKAVTDMRSTLEEYKKQCVNERATYVYSKVSPDDVGNLCYEFGDRWGKPWEKNIWFIVPSRYEAETNREINKAKVDIKEYERKVKTAYGSKFDEAIQSYNELLKNIKKLN